MCEHQPNILAKLFDVSIRGNDFDPILSPSMTTSNQIITQQFDEVVYIPLEAVHSDDSLSYVYTAKGKKQIVLPGDQNENFIIVEKGIELGDEVYLSLPTNVEKYPVVGRELIPEIKEREAERKRKEEEAKAANEQQVQRPPMRRGGGKMQRQQ